MFVFNFNQIHFIMKKLLLIMIFIANISLLNAQTNCATPILISTNGTITAPAPAGTIEALCFTETTNVGVTGAQTTTPFSGLWYKFVPTSSGTVVVSSNLTTNIAPLSIDTRVSIFSGACGGLTCVTSADDVSASNFLSTANFVVLTGNTYYIYWDNLWNDKGFSFDFTFTAVSCLPVTVNASTAITTTSATLNWAPSASAPPNYEIEYGPVGFVQGAGTTVTSITNSKVLSSLTPNANYDFYVRAACNATTFSAWSAVSNFGLIKTLPYSSGLDSPNDLIGWTIFGDGIQGLGNNVAAAQAGAGYWVFNSPTTALPTAKNNWLFTPAISLVANQQVAVSFYHRATTNPRTLRVTSGNANTNTAQTNLILAASIPSSTTWVQITTPMYTAPTTGIYYFGFNDTTNLTTPPPTATFMRIDTINITTTLATTTFDSNSFTVSPNPCKDYLTISNSNNSELNSISITDLNGRTVKNISFNNVVEAQISVTELAQGIYMLKINSENGSVTKKIIKE